MQGAFLRKFALWIALFRWFLYQRASWTIEGPHFLKRSLLFFLGKGSLLRGTLQRVAL